MNQEEVIAEQRKRIIADQKALPPQKGWDVDAQRDLLTKNNYPLPMTPIPTECCKLCWKLEAGIYNACSNPSCLCHKPTSPTDGTMEERFWKKFEFLLRLAGLGAKESGVVRQGRDDLLTFIHSEISRARMDVAEELKTICNRTKTERGLVRAIGNYITKLK